MISRALHSTHRPLSSKSLFAAAWFLFIGVCSCRQEAVAYERRTQVVEVAPASSTDAARDLLLNGSLEPERSWALSFATLGTVEQVLVREGDTVGRGQVLARLSAKSFQDALGIASSKARQADDAYRRLEPMYKNQTLPEIKMVEIESGRDQARLMVSMASKSLADTVLHAPEPGIILRRFAEPGMNLAPGMPAFTLVQTSSMLAVVSLPEKQIARLAKGDTATVTVDALGTSFEGKVTDVAISADILTRTYQVKIAVPNKDRALRVGMLADARFHHKEGGRAVVVPSRSVHVDALGIEHVFVVGPNNQLQRRRVKVLGFLQEGTALSEGVREGEQVVTSETPMLADGMVVRVRGGEDDAGAGDAR
jgi:membrane fusion protein, multidrug efflux system